MPSAAAMSIVATTSNRTARAIFADDHSFQVPSVRGGSNVAPMIHYADLVGMVSRAVRARRGTADEFPDTPAEDTPPEAIFFTAATDGCEATLAQVLRRIGAGHLPFSPLEAALEAALRDPCVIKWNQDAVFPADRASLRFPDGLLTQFKDVWGEFLADQNLLPVSFVFAGPPGSGKTAAARALASRCVSI